MNMLIDEYIAKEKIRSDKIKKLMSNTSYIDWLNNFTKDKDGFGDDYCLYSNEDISEIDKENIEKLSLFYEGIDEYAESNHIYPIACESGIYYRVKLNDFHFEIGALIGQGTVFFFNKSEELEKEFIDFNDIMSGKKQSDVDQINTRLDSLSNMIRTAYDSGVPIEAIINTFNNTINEITYNNEEKEPIKKVLK